MSYSLINKSGNLCPAAVGSPRPSGGERVETDFGPCRTSAAAIASPDPLDTERRDPAGETWTVVSPVVMHPIPGLLVSPRHDSLRGRGGRDRKVRAGVYSSGPSAVPVGRMCRRRGTQLVTHLAAIAG